MNERLDPDREGLRWAVNTPNTAQLNQFFKRMLGIGRVSSSWHWQGMTAERAEQKLDELVSLRGDIAHRGHSSEHVTRETVSDDRDHVTRLVGRTGNIVNAGVEKATARTESTAWIAQGPGENAHRLVRIVSPPVRTGADDVHCVHDPSLTHLRIVPEVRSHRGPELRGSLSKRDDGLGNWVGCFEWLEVTDTRIHSFLVNMPLTKCLPGNFVVRQSGRIP